MLFNSYEFIFMFLPFTFFLYFFLLSKRLITGAKGFLVFASLFFYSWWNVLYLPIILSSMLFNYVVGNSLNKKSEQAKVSKKQLLIFGLAANLSLLGYFKYTDFYMPAVDKYDLYYEFILNNPYPKNYFFDLLRETHKEYYLVDTKAILLEALYQGEEDIFYADDTHWSYKASRLIANDTNFINSLRIKEFHADKNTTF